MLREKGALNSSTLRLKIAIPFSLAVLLSALSTSVLILHGLGINLFSITNSSDNVVVRAQPTFLMNLATGFQNSSYLIAPASWLFLGIGVWVWKGKARALFQAAGFDKDVFRLLVRTKGGKSRARLLKTLMLPKDRMQLSRDLGLDWKAVDRHLRVLQEFGLIREEVNVQANIRLFGLTKVGEILLNVLEKMEELEKEYNNQSEENWAETTNNKIEK
jgi:DNA-binding transcriptional ArsR family regulator